MEENIPKVTLAIIGGSSTLSINFPEDLKRDDVIVLKDNLKFSTPYGESPSFKLIKVNGNEILTCKMHGWRPGITTRAIASKQVFWVFQQAGVKKIVAEGGVGSINRLLNLRDIVIPDDYIDHSMRQDVGFNGPHLMVMRDPICPEISSALKNSSEVHLMETERKVFNRGVYVNTDGRHFESRAEVQMFKTWFADIVGQSIAPEVYLAREIGACYAGVYMVVNFAEGIIKDWEHSELKEIFYNESETIGNILLDTIKKLPHHQEGCKCKTYRKNTLLLNQH